MSIGEETGDDPRTQRTLGLPGSFQTKEHQGFNMAESVVNETVANLSAAVNETAKNATGRAVATPEGMFVAYASLVSMALLPIFFGSFRSVKSLTEQKVR